MYSTDELIAAYFRNWANNNEGEDFWSFEEINDLKTNPTRFWEITLLLIEKAPSLAALSYVAAGPLEDLLREHDNSFFDLISNEAKTNKRFLYTLAGVWLDEEDAFYSALQQLVREHRLDEINPLNNERWSHNNLRPG